jgi:hypothetical protein
MSWSALRGLALVALALPSAAALAGGALQSGRVARGPEISASVTPYVFDGDVRDLPRPVPWKPGDPIREIPQRFYGEPGEAPAIGRQSGIDALYERQLEASRAADEGGIIVSRNFEGQGFTGAMPPDTNGDVGPSYYIQAINHGDGGKVAIYDKAEPTPAEVATFMIDSLGGGACTNGGGDPIVLYDRFAGRWLLMEFARGMVSTLCVHVSQSGDPVSGGWYSYPITVPIFPDYPKLAVWPTDANGGGGSYVVTTNEDDPGLYALDRGAMLTGAATTYQRFTVPALWEYGVQALTPADPDGPNEPATYEPAIVMRHRDTERFGGPPATGDWLEMWSFDVDWVTPANTTLTQESGVEIADFNSELCRPVTGCFPQPGSDIELDSLHDIIMWRLQYYNHGDRETLMGNFTVDVDGTDHGGVRWFELQRTGGGSWNLRQEGTYSIDESNRWMAGSSMDRLGNIAVAYNVVSETIWPGLRYTGRFADEAFDVMSFPEASIHEGAASNISIRWGDYSAMGLDPEDDCTFWFTGMDNSVSVWRTQITSLRFDTCDCDLFPLPPSTSAAAAGDNSIDVMWDDSELASVAEYYVRRSHMAGGPYETIAVVPDSSPGFPGGAGYIYEDDGVSGGITYYYVVIAGDGGPCRSPAANETSAVTTGSCDLPPDFDGLRFLSSPHSADCGLDLEWEAATAPCGGGITYSVYRSTWQDFTPGPGHMIASGLAGTSYADINALLPDRTYHYVVRAVDGSNGAEDGNLVRRGRSPAGPWIPYTWSDDAGDTDPASMTGGSLWHVDGSEGHSGPSVYKTGTYYPNACTALTSPTMRLGSGAALTFWTKYDINRMGDKGIVQISTDGGSIWERVPMSYPYYVPTTNDDCGLPAGNYFASTNLTWAEYSADLSAWDGEEIRIRFLLSADSSGSGQGWWVDDITITNVVEEGLCSADKSCPDNPFVDVQPDGAIGACTTSAPELTASLAGGTGPFTYQWYRDGLTLAGETASTYQTAEQGSHRYNVKVRAAGCTDDITDSDDTEVTLSNGPLFDGVRSVSGAHQPVCSLSVEWEPATAVCGGPVEYFVYRDNGAGVEAIPANLVASGLSGTSWVDSGALVEGNSYHYRVRALDLSTMEFDTNTAEVSAEAIGPYSGVNPIFYEDFEDPSSFAGWTVSTGPGPHTCGEWVRSDSSEELAWYGAGYYAVAKSADCAPVMPQTSTSLDSPVIDLDFTGINSVTLEYAIAYIHGDGDDGTVEVWDGTKWEVVWSDGDESIQEHHSIDVTAHAAGNDSFQVRFNYQNAADDQWFSVDNIAVIVDAYNSCSTASGPPPAPDGGSGTTPLRGDRLTPSGDTIEVGWDSSSCAAAEYNLLYGDLDDVAGYLLGGSACSIGASGTYLWSGVPAGDLFFLVVGADGAGVESSWGVDGLGIERNGMAHSGECSTTSKEISTSCP